MSAPPAAERLIVALDVPSVDGGSSTDDHTRLTTPTDAIRAGADHLVVGRPMRTAPDPKAAARSIIDEIAAAGTEVRS